MNARGFLLAAGLLCGASPLGAQGIDFRGPGGGFSSPVTTDPVSATGAWTFDNVAGTRLACVDGISTSPATTADANADSLFGASATSKKALVLQAKASPTAAFFEVQDSLGAPVLGVTRDGALEVNQKTGVVSTRMLKVSYQGTEQMSVANDGNVYSRVGFNGGGGFFTTNAAGDATALGKLSGNHLLSNGTSPTAPAGGGTCGTSAPSIAGKDSGFKLTVGSVAATSCTVTFGTAWATAPVCVANAATTTTGLNIVTGTSTVTISAAALTPAEVLHVVCVGF